MPSLSNNFGEDLMSIKNPGSLYFGIKTIPPPQCPSFKAILPARFCEKITVRIRKIRNISNKNGFHIILITLTTRHSKKPSINWFVFFGCPYASQGLARSDFHYRDWDQDQKCLSLNNETETEKVWVSMTRPRPKMSKSQ